MRRDRRWWSEPVFHFILVGALLVTDHSEFLGEVEACTTPGSFGFDSETCQAFRQGGSLGQTVLGILTAEDAPMRLADVCGEDGTACLSFAGAVWQRTIDAANEA